MIEVRNLVKQYDKLTALYGISFTLNDGAALGILGQSGSGKSTLLNILCGCLSPTSGSIILNGIDMRRHPKECKRLIGYMPEKPPLYSEMTVSEYLKFSCSLKRIGKADIADEMKRVKHAVNLEAEDSLLCSDLSIADKQKLSLCQTIVGNPEILIFDDPTKGLENSKAEELLGIIKEVSKGKTVVFASRLLTECIDLCENVIIINRGRVAVNSTLAGLSAEISECTRLKLRVLAPRAVARGLFRDMAEISDIELQTADEKGAVDIVLTYPTKCDLREKLWRYTQSAGVPVLEMKQLNISLEDIYLQLSGER
ncbi:MAG: ABC transporter ATP-binding protein [Lachnospiraceae bacterium]